MYMLVELGTGEIFLLLLKLLYAWFREKVLEICYIANECHGCKILFQLCFRLH